MFTKILFAWFSRVLQLSQGTLAELFMRVAFITSLMMLMVLLFHRPMSSLPGPTATETSMATEFFTPTPTETATPLAFPTVRPSEVLDSTPTQEVYSRDKGCALLNLAWDDPLYGCNIARNPMFLAGASKVGVIDVPRQWTLQEGSNLPTTCFNTQCRIDFAATGEAFSFVGYRQTLQGVEAGQCYVAKMSMGFLVLGSNPLIPFPPDVFVYFNNNLQPYTQEDDRPLAGQANFIRSLREFVWPVRGGTNPTPEIMFGVRRNFASYANGSHANLFGLFFFAAPEAYCAQGAISLP